MLNSALGGLLKRRLIYIPVIFSEYLNMSRTTISLTLYHLYDLSAIPYVKEN